MGAVHLRQNYDEGGLVSLEVNEYELDKLVKQAYNTYKPYRAVTSSMYDEEDYLQEAMLYVWSNRDKWDSERGGFSTFVFWYARSIWSVMNKSLFTQKRMAKELSMEMTIYDNHGDSEMKLLDTIHSKINVESDAIYEVTVEGLNKTDRIMLGFLLGKYNVKKTLELMGNPYTEQYFYSHKFKEFKQRIRKGLI